MVIAIMTSYSNQTLCQHRYYYIEDSHWKIFNPTAQKCSKPSCSLEWWENVDPFWYFDRNITLTNSSWFLWCENLFFACVYKVIWSRNIHCYQICAKAVTMHCNFMKVKSVNQCPMSWFKVRKERDNSGTWGGTVSFFFGSFSSM